jgi:hypothetical protein
MDSQRPTRNSDIGGIGIRVSSYMQAVLLGQWIRFYGLIGKC